MRKNDGRIVSYTKLSQNIEQFGEKFEKEKFYRETLKIVRIWNIEVKGCFIA